MYRLYVFAKDRIIVKLNTNALCFIKKALNTLCLSSNDKKSQLIKSNIQEL